MIYVRICSCDSVDKFECRNHIEAKTINLSFKLERINNNFNREPSGIPKLIFKSLEIPNVQQVVLSLNCGVSRL